MKNITTTQKYVINGQRWETVPRCECNKMVTCNYGRLTSWLPAVSQAAAPAGRSRRSSELRQSVNSQEGDHSKEGPKEQQWRQTLADASPPVSSSFLWAICS